MKRILIVIISILFVLTACSDPSEEPPDQSASLNQQEENKAESPATSNAGNSYEETADESTPAETNDQSTDFNIVTYLKENYPIENTHYEIEEWESDTEITDFTVNIIPQTKQYGQEINEIFQNSAPYEDNRTKTMFDTAEQIMNELPKVNEKVHIDSVNWVSNIDDFSVSLIQDYENSNVNAGDKEDKETLSDFSSEQIEYARVWLQLGPNQEIDELNVRHIKAGEPLNPTDDNSAVYPEDVIQLAGSRLVDGSVTYSGNGDGTINVYNVPLRWDGDYSLVDESFYTDIIDNTELVYVDPGEDEKVIELIHLLHIHS
ncbi:hypothetical protein [Gracilibacillus oryzae]|uniref:hypothetical protein n=1 Tax=Gracilibacillus oryzae TaxID=1672701 RepID=UPI0038993FDA